MYKKSFFINMNLLKKSIASSKNREAGEIWLKVNAFVLSGSYSTYKQCKGLVSMVMSGYSDEYIGRSFGIESTTVRIHKRNLSNELYSFFGENFFELFKDFSSNKKEILQRVSNIETLDMRANDILPEVIAVLIDRDVGTNSPLDSISLDACRREISFLVQHSLSKIKQELSDLDPLKLDYLLRVINRTSGSMQDRYELLQLLNGGENGND